MECVPCQKTFTGQVCYQQHMASEKHKKKVIHYNVLNKSGVLSALENKSNATNANHFQCCTCDISFNSLESFQKHVLTREHAEKILSKDAERSSDSDDVSSSQPSTEQKMVDTKDENNSVDKILNGFEQQNENFYFPSNLSCDVCRKTFSGPEPYRQHQESAVHLKKVKLQKTGSITFSCEPCKKIFSGPFPYNQHMSSEVHKKKMENLQFIEKCMSETDSSSGVHASKVEENSSKMDVSNSMHCSVCNVYCSGSIPYQQHLGGSAHKKNAIKMRLQNGIYSSPAVQLLCNGEAGVSQMVPNGINQQSRSQEMEVDCIIPGLSGNLKMVSSEELLESIKMFEVDKPIDFDE